MTVAPFAVAVYACGNALGVALLAITYEDKAITYEDGPAPCEIVAEPHLVTYITTLN